MSDRDDINQNEGKKKVLRELSEAIRSPVFQEKVRRNVAGEKARFAYEEKILKPSQRQIEESFAILLYRAI